MSAEEIQKFCTQQRRLMYGFIICICNPDDISFVVPKLTRKIKANKNNPFLMKLFQFSLKKKVKTIHILKIIHPLNYFFFFLVLLCLAYYTFTVPFTCEVFLRFDPWTTALTK